MQDGVQSVCVDGDEGTCEPVAHKEERQNSAESIHCWNLSGFR